MKTRTGRIAVVIGMAGLAGLLLLAIQAWLSPCPIELSLVSVEPSGVPDESGKESLLVTLAATNRGTKDAVTQNGRKYQVRVFNRWVDMEERFGFGGITSGHRRETMLVMPSGAEACRLYLQYDTERWQLVWKTRFLEIIGIRGRKFVAQLPLLCYLFWPDQNKKFQVPPQWIEAVLELEFPGGVAKRVETVRGDHQQTATSAPTPINNRISDARLPR